MDFYDLELARQRFAERIAEAQNEARIVAPLPKTESTVSRFLSAFTGLFAGRGNRTSTRQTSGTSKVTRPA